MGPTIHPLITPSLLASISGHPNLPRNSWYFIAATTLSLLNRPDEIPKIYQHALTHGSGGPRDIVPEVEEQLDISRRIREAMIKAVPIGGLPKVSWI
jgi:hypothetical protein